MAFIAKHLPDKFYLDGDTRTSLRDRLFREVVSNLLIHREFSNGFPAKMIIENDRVYSENWSRPNGGGIIDPEKFSPFPKNPVIAKFFHEIGRVDELGSGIRNTFKYSSIYASGSSPEFIEGDIFKTIVPLKAKENVGSKEWPQVWSEIRRKFGNRFGEGSEISSEKVRSNFIGDSRKSSEIGSEKMRRKFKEDSVKRVEKILKLIYEDNHISAAFIAEKAAISSRAIEKQLSKLKRLGIIERIGAAKGGYWKILIEMEEQM